MYRQAPTKQTAQSGRFSALTDTTLHTGEQHTCGEQVSVSKLCATREVAGVWNGMGQRFWFERCGWASAMTWPILARILAGSVDSIDTMHTRTLSSLPPAKSRNKGIHVCSRVRFSTLREHHLYARLDWQLSNGVVTWPKHS